MNSILLAIALIGGPHPEHRLILGCDPATPQGKRLIADVRDDAWLKSQFVVSLEEKPWLEPRYRFYKSGEWERWPRNAEMPNGSFCTSGMCLKVLRPHLEKQIPEANRPQEFYEWWEMWGPPPVRDPVPVPDPAPEEN